jgi:hypothetical protein
VTERVEGEASEVSLIGTVMGQVSVPMPLTPTTIGEVVLEEVLLQGEPVVPRASEGSSVALIRASGDMQTWEDP